MRASEIDRTFEANKENKPERSRISDRVTVGVSVSLTDENQTMSMNNNTDFKLLQNVNSKLAMRGIRSPCHVAVACRGGEITLTGTVVQAHQKDAAMRIAQGVSGVKRVINQLIVKVTQRS